MVICFSRRIVKGFTDSNVKEKPRFGEANLGAVAGAVTSAVGGLFAVGLVPAIQTGRAGYLIATPIMSFLCFLVSGPIGWYLGGQAGPRFAESFKGSPQAEIFAGAAAGLLPVVVVAWWGWRMMG